MSKNNFVAKHMHTYNKSSVHIDKKKEGISEQEDINQGIYDFLNSYDRYQEETYGDDWKKAKEIAAKNPINPRLYEKVSISKEQLNKQSLDVLHSYAIEDPYKHKCYLDLTNRQNKITYYNAFVNIKNIILKKEKVNE